MTMRRLFMVAVAGLAVVAAAVIACGVVAPGSVPFAPGVAGGIAVRPGAPLPMLQDIDPEDLDPARDIPGVPPVALAPPGGAIVQSNGIRIPKPAMPTGPRRIGIQVGHWMTDQVPAELGKRITFQTGASWDGVDEVDVNMDVAERVKAQLTARGYIVDILPTTVPVGYIATGLDWDALGISRNMLAYFAFNWGRYQHAAAPHTPAAILEMGFLSNDYDRELMVDKADGVATAIVNGIQRFLDEVPRSKIFGEDLVVPQQRGFPSPSPRT
ncbi:MAG: hypothetical protein E6J35_02755 [Chloroflexi bacterium]|nr:MAG: hypothetical protein E6J35_02755 [Chloroflexota bacterium]